MRICYYAHCIDLYDTSQEKLDIKLLRDLGFFVENPNKIEHSNAYNKLKEEGKCGMNYFCDVVRGCSVLAFRSLSDGNITAGVAKEIECAKEDGIPVIELSDFLNARYMGVESTREYLRKMDYENRL